MGSESAQRIAHGSEETCQPLDPAFPIDLRHHPAQHDAVLERIAGSRGRLRPVGEHHEATVLSPPEIGRVQGEPPLVDRDDVGARAQEHRVAEDEVRRDEAAREEVLAAVEIPQHGVEQSGALRQAFGEPPPLLRGNHDRKRGKVPRPGGAARISVSVIAYAVLVQQRAGFVPTLA